MSIVSFERVLITGARGFVGTYLVSALNHAFPDAVIYPLTRDEKPGYIQADVADSVGMNNVISRIQPDLVIHLAAQSAVVAQPYETWRVNAGGAIALAEAIARHAPTATVLNISSSEVYGHSFLRGRANEETETRPASVYGRSKITAEAIFSDILSSTNRLIHVRPFNHTGPGQDERFVVASFAAQIARIESGQAPASIKVGNLESRRDFLDVRDVVRAYIALLTQVAHLPMRGVFNICSGQNIQIREILDVLLSCALVPIAVEQDPTRLRPSDIPVADGDCQKLREVTGWSPAIAFRQTLVDILEHYRAIKR
ncbi:GDP-4-dehydro-6-deoxy-D-mannose reductase [Agrobacterium vitis]|nr:GDP-4-dehydro-6-deoxy-D-mannose reductase [Agrobacterium vitis]MBE1436546.1 GDP-4-dehydro-6-deoxy-D-mannose reductase [Agrobacterium vitis]